MLPNFQITRSPSHRPGSSSSSTTSSRVDFLRNIVGFIYNAARRRKVYCIGRGFTAAKRHLQQKGWINLGKVNLNGVAWQ